MQSKKQAGNLSQVAEIKSLCRDNLNIYSGNDDQILPVLSVGGIGVISVLSNIFPKQTHDMIDYYLNGDITTSTNMQLEMIPFIKALFSEVNPIPVKAALNMSGFSVGIPRMPLVEMTEKGKENLKKELLKYSKL